MEFSTSENIKCHEAILRSGEPERVADLIKLCRTLEVPESAQKNLMFMYDFQHSEEERVQDSEWPEPGATATCDEIRSKYSLDAICRACTRYTSSNKTDTQKEKELLLYLLNTKPDKSFFPKNEETKRVIEETFTSAENIQNGSGRYYTTIYRTFYKALAYLLNESVVNWKTAVKSQFDADQLYQTWKTLNPSCCSNGENRAIKTKIGYLYGAEFTDSPDKKEYRDTVKKQAAEYKKSAKQANTAAQAENKTANPHPSEKKKEKREEKAPVINEEFLNVGKELSILPSIKDNILIDNGYDMITSGDRLEWLCFEAGQERQGICLDAIHIKEYEGIYLMLKIGGKKNLLTESQLESLTGFIEYKLGRITTSSVIALCSVLIKNRYKIKAEIIQPSDTGYARMVTSARQQTAAPAQDIDSDEKNFLMTYARSFRPGTGDEDCIRHVNGIPQISRARVLLPDELPFTIKVKSILKEGQWNVFKKKVHSTLERNEIFRIHDAGIWKEDDSSHKFTYYCASNKIRGMETIVRSTILQILENMTENPDFGVFPGKDL